MKTNMPVSRLRKFAIATTMLAPLAVGVASANTTLRVATHAGLKSLDPVWTTAYIVRTHGYLVYDTLFAMDEQMQPKPQMVEAWTVSADQRRWTFTLRPGLKWADGTDVTAADCVASLERWGKRDGKGQALFAKIASLTAPDAKTIVMDLDVPDAAVLYSLAKISSNVPFMMPAHVADSSPSMQITDPTGSGPYMFDRSKWKPGKLAVYQRNPHYEPRADKSSGAAGAKIAKADTINLVHYGDDVVAAKALIRGDVHYMESPSLSVLPMLEAAKDVVVAPTAPPGGIGMMRFNTRIPPFDNPAIRRAVLLSVDQSAYMKAAFGTEHRWWRTCYSIYPCGTAYENEAGNWVMKFGNPSAAAFALREAGYDGTPVVILNPTDIPVIAAFTKVTAERLRKIGMKVEVQDMTWHQLLARRAEAGGWNLFDTWWMGGDLTDPSAIAFSGNPKTGWYGWPADAKLETYRAEFTKAATDEDRARLAADVQKRVLDNGSLAILGQFFEPVAYRAGVKGITWPVQYYWGMSP